MASQDYPMEAAHVYGFEVPVPLIPLPIQTRDRVLTLPFVFDTAAAVSLIPATLATAIDLLIPGSDPEVTETDSEAPTTLRGRLSGYRGTFGTRLLGQALTLPCFYYTPEPTAPATSGPAGRRVVRREADDVNAWMLAIESGVWADDRRSPPFRRQPCVLGRLGFLSKFSVLVDGRDRARRTTVSNESADRPKRRPS